MVDNSNNKKPDPQFEELGWQGWQDFKLKFEEIKKDYDQYGDIVLEKRLGESINIYKDAFASEIFIHEIYEIWKERYQYVANTLGEMISFFEKYYKNGFNGFFKSLFPETSTIGKGSNFSLSEKLYNYIVQEARKNYEKTILVLKGSDLYKFSLEENEGYYRYKIKMARVQIIKID